MERKAVFLDTSFFLRLLNERDVLHRNAVGYYRYFLEQGIVLKTSTIAIAEYCVRGKLDELPLKEVQIVPFNIHHAVRTGQLAAIAFAHKEALGLPDRRIIPNDSKIFAQADLDEQVSQLATSDQESLKVIRLFKAEAGLQFDPIDIRTPYHETFGLLGLE